ncbi:hypothetical protein D3C80_1408080 [compost metagenome]
MANRPERIDKRLYTPRTRQGPFYGAIAPNPHAARAAAHRGKDSDRRGDRVADNVALRAAVCLYLCPFDLLYKGTFVRILMTSTITGGADHGCTSLVNLEPERRYVENDHRNQPG